jgi:hypothetical protein
LYDWLSINIQSYPSGITLSNLVKCDLIFTAALKG